MISFGYPKKLNEFMHFLIANERFESKLRYKVLLQMCEIQNIDHSG